MSKRRAVGDIVWLKPNSGFIGNSDQFQAQIQEQGPPDYCMLSCDDLECKEWDTVWTVNRQPDEALYHVSECQMLDEPYDRS